MSIALIPVTAFDANYEKYIAFSFAGNQVISNRLVIFDNSNNMTVYNELQNVSRLSHRIPPNALVNGKTYDYQLTVYDINNTPTVSSRSSFVCITTPVWGFENLSNGRIINSSNYPLQIKYGQIQGELLNEFRIEMYGSNKLPVWNSGTLLSNIRSVNISGLLDGTRYSLRMVGNTVNGFPLDTGFIDFQVLYNQSGLYSVLQLTNKEWESAVEVSTDIVMLYGRPTPDPPIWKENRFIDLREEGGNIIFDEGFSIENDFILDIFGFGFKRNSPIITMSSGENKVIIYWRKDSLYQNFQDIPISTYAELNSVNSLTYVLFSNKIDEDISESQLIYMRLTRIDGLYKLNISKYQGEADAV